MLGKYELTDKLIGLYKRDAEAVDRYSVRFREFETISRTLEETLQKITDLPISNITAEALDNLEYSLKSRLARIVVQLNGGDVLNIFGRELAIWAWVNMAYADENRFLKEVCKASGENPLLMEKSRMSTMYLNRDEYSSRLVTKFYDLITATNDYDTCYTFEKGLSLEKVLAQNCRSKTCEFNKYSLVPLNTPAYITYNIHDDEWWHIHECGPEVVWESIRKIEGKNARSLEDISRNEFAGKFYKIWLDSPVGIGLFYNDVPCASISFIPEIDNALLIVQMQGIKPMLLRDSSKILIDERYEKISSRGIFNIGWQDILVKYAENLAKQLDYKKIGIRGAVNNIWTRPNRYAKEPHLTIEQAEKKYNYIAKRLGFKKEKNNNWYKKLI